MTLQAELLSNFERFAKTAVKASTLMDHMVHTLHDKVSRYNWVVFYEIDPNNPEMLVVGPYAGSFTPNVRIPLSKGLCGAAARTGKAVVVDDVSKAPRYLAGSSMVKSEIVVPLFANKKLAGELDIESYFAATFTDGERRFVEDCANIVTRYLEKK